MKFRIDFKIVILMLLFIAFITLRIFVNSQYYYISGDEGKYLTLARHFPYHTLDNKSLFLLHPPIFPYIIHFFSFLFKDYIAGITVSIISSIISFVLIYKLLSLFIKDFYVIAGTLLLYTLSVGGIFLSQNVLKESFTVMLFLASIYFFIRGISQNKKYLVHSSILGAITALTIDHVIFLFPTFMIAILFFHNKKTTKLLYAILPILVMLIFYSFWPYTRFYIYTNNDYYSTGIDGIIEKVNDFGIKQILNPVFFPETAVYGGFTPSDLKHYAFVFGYMFNILPFSIPLGVTNEIFLVLLKDKLFYFKLLSYGFMFFLFLYSTFNVIKKYNYERKIKNNYNLFFILIFLIFLFPITQQSSSFRMVFTSIIFLFYFISLGFVQFFGKFKKLIILFIFLLILFVPFWIKNNPYLVFELDRVVEAEKTAGFMNKLPKDGIIAQVGYSPELNYLTDKRIISMPSNPQNLNFILKRFNISYVVYGQHYWAEVSEKNKDKIFNYETIKYVQENPEKFRLIAVIKEDFKNLDKEDEMHIYEVTQ